MIAERIRKILCVAVVNWNRKCQNTASQVYDIVKIIEVIDNFKRIS